MLGQHQKKSHQIGKVSDIQAILHHNLTAIEREHLPIYTLTSFISQSGQHRPGRALH